jgi:hypothetical protein
MLTISVDFEVYKQPTVRRQTEQVPYNDVIRELLGMEAKEPMHGMSGNTSFVGDWTTKGVRFPQGTEFRSDYKGSLHRARVEAGALVFNGRRFDAPSAAAMSVTDSAVNGWVFWECQSPGESSWKPMRAFRR